ncbi:uncharacterized protein LOC111130585 [Crassostrea virginica]
MKQKKLEVSCTRRRNLKQIRQSNEAFQQEVTSQDTETSKSSKKVHHIVVPGATLETGSVNSEEVRGITETDGSESNDSKVISNGNSSEECGEIDRVICDSDHPHNSGKVVVNSEDTKQETDSSENTPVTLPENRGKGSKNPPETLPENREKGSDNLQEKLSEIRCDSGNIQTNVQGVSDSVEEHELRTESHEDNSSLLIGTPEPENVTASDMKGAKTDLRPIEEESEEKSDDRRSDTSGSRKAGRKDRSSRRGSSAVLSSPRHASSRHSFSCVEGRTSLLKESNKPRRSQSALERPKSKARGSFSDPFKFTKQELEWYLPRKSFFDCHDKALKEAGVETAVTSSRREQMKQRVTEKIQRERELREKRKELETPKPEEIKPEASAAMEDSHVGIEDIGNEREADAKSEIDKSEADDDVVIAKLQEVQTSMSKHTQTRKTSKHKKKQHDYDEDDVRVDHQPLLQYLRYVQDHPEEFHAHRKQLIQQEHVGSRASPWIVRLAEINERRNVSTAQCLVSKSVVLDAARDIRPRTTDPGQWTMSQKERALLVNMTPGKVNAFTAVKQDLPTHDSQNQDDGKSDFEKEKVKLEKWLKTVTTAGLIKAKELALRELGEEDTYQTRWWSSLQTCSYLRQKGVNPT